MGCPLAGFEAENHVIPAKLVLRESGEAGIHFCVEPRFHGGGKGRDLHIDGQAGGPWSISMRRKQILVAAIVLAVFCLGVLVGHRVGRSPSSVPAFASRDSPRGELAGCVDFHDAGPHAGKTGCVSGRVLRVYTSGGGNTFFDFCEDYHDCPFSSVIFSSDKRKFGDLQSLSGRQIEIHGLITVYQGRPEIIIHDPEQIRVAP